jgi:LL-diaminopimelate aminotransferase
MRRSFPPRSRALSALPGYPMAHIPARRRELEAAGVDVIDLGAGDADLAPPPAAVGRLQEAAAEPSFSRYAFQLGLPPFREAVADWMVRRFDLELDPYGEILPLIGSKEGIAHLLMATLDPGDVAVFPDPGYQAYLGGTILAGATPHPVPLRPEDAFLLPFHRLPPAVAERTRVLVLNYPNNPTAAVAPLGYLEEAVAFCRERGIVLLYDNAYSEMAFDGYRPPSILEVKGAREVAVEFHSFSKTYNMTGWRLGWAAGNADLIASLARLKTFVDTGVFLAVQAAGIAALHEWDTWVPGNVEAFRRRRDAAVEAFQAAGYPVEPPRATMYLWIPVPAGVASDPEVPPDATFAQRALDEAGVVVLPGSALGPGGAGFVRVALTRSEDRLREGARRLGGMGRG